MAWEKWGREKAIQREVENYSDDRHNKIARSEISRECYEQFFPLCSHDNCDFGTEKN
jgi:hypothetical protein